MQSVSKVKLSVVLATRNEEENLGRCLAAVVGIADEIVVVDGRSTDRTVEIAKKYGAKVLVTDNQPIFHINKQKALDLASGDWVLLLDADEEVSPTLAREVRKVVGLSTPRLNNWLVPKKLKSLYLRHLRLLVARDGRVGTETGDMVAFFVPRPNYFLGRFLRKGGQYPDFTLRLVKRGKGKFMLQTVHDQMQIDGRVSLLEGELLHHATPTFSRYLDRFNRYTSLTADELMKLDLPVNVFTAAQWLLVKPAVTFGLLYFRHLGFVDGFPGFVFAIFSGLHHAVSYIKYWQHKYYAT